MTRLDWEKANRQEKTGRRRPKGKKKDSEARQLAMALFVWNHNIACFKCGQTETRWAKTGFTKRGPWAICKNCVTKKR